MKTAIFGGAFNPIHIGHVALCNAFCDVLHFDRVLIMPSKLSPHKSNDGLIDSEHRVEMCKIAREFFRKGEVSTLEIEREGKSYTVDTIRQVKAMYPDDSIFLICGSDMFLTLHDWREPIEIFKMATICAAKRGDENDEKISRQNDMLCKLGAETVLIDSFIPPVSSTNIREMLKGGENCEKLLPDGVYDYIIKNGLYKK